MRVYLRLLAVVLPFTLLISPNTRAAPPNKPLIAGGQSHTLAINSDNSLYAWGENSYGQIGLGDNTDRNNPTQVGPGYVAVAAGWYYSLALKAYGSLWAWGRNTNGQLGLGDTTDRNAPTQLKSFNARRTAVVPLF